MTPVGHSSSLIIPKRPVLSEKTTCERVFEVAFRILVPLVAIFLFYAIMPITFSAIHLPFVAGALSLCYLYLLSSSREEAVRVKAPLPPEAPRGIGNAGANCWVNALTQVLRSDKGLKSWIEKTPNELTTILKPVAFLPLNLFFTPEELVAHPLESPPSISQVSIRGDVLNQCHQAISQMSPEARNHLLSYLTVFQSMDVSKRLASMQFCTTYKQFFARYDQAVATNAREAHATSQALRLVFSRNSPITENHPQISANKFQEVDPVEAFTYIEHLIPPHLKVEIDLPRGRYRDRRPHQGHFTVDIVGKNPNFQQMLDHYFQSNDTQFVQAPPSLWPAVKRFEFGRPGKNFFQKIASCCVSQGKARTLKIDKAVHFPPVVTLQTVDEGEVRYELDSGLAHQGNGQGGHYVAYVRKQNAQGEYIWYEANDANVRPLKGKALTRALSQIYLPHYSRIN